MASSPRLAMTSPSSARTTQHTPGSSSRVLSSPLSDESIWKRLRDAGFDEESIKRRDKAALIGYITKLEAEIFDHQHHMGLLLLERKSWTSKYEKLQSSVESDNIKHKCAQAAHLSAVAEAKKREDNMKKTIEVQKECIADIEKAMHEMRAESAETKVAAEIKLVEARAMVEDARKKFTDAEAKLLAAESLQSDVNRYHHTAERKLQEVEAREDDLRRRIISLKSDCDAKENEINLERQTLCERQKSLQQGQERLLEGQALLNQREGHIFNKTQELHRLSKELDDSKADLENERRHLNEEKSKLTLSLASLSTKEEELIKKEAMLSKKEHELLLQQENLASKENADNQKLLADHEIVVKRRMSEFEAELDKKRKMVENDIEAKRRAWELKEVDLRHLEELIIEREHDLNVQSKTLADRENEITVKSKSLDEKERNLNAAEKEAELTKILLQKEQEEINNAKSDLQKSLVLLEDRKKQVNCAEENLEAKKSETNEFLALETNLKEEIDMVRAEMEELKAQADELNAEKAKFEAEWEVIDEKREVLRKEAEYIANEKQAVIALLKDERDSLKLEKDQMHEKYKQDSESLSRDREDFIREMQCERAELFNNIQNERASILLDIETRRIELENLIDERREELEMDFREKQKAFEQEKGKELEYISSLKEIVAKDSDYIDSELRRLETERDAIKMDRERRDREWAEMNNSIEDLKLQREKLENQRELLHADRVNIETQIEHLKRLELVEASLNKAAEVEMQQSDVDSTLYLKQRSVITNADRDKYKTTDHVENVNGLDLHSTERSANGSPSSAPLSWIRRCAKLVFKQSPVTSDNKKACLTVARSLNTSNGQISNGNAKRQGLFSEEVQRMHNLEFEMKNDAKGNCSHSSSEQGSMAGRKRKILNSSPSVLVDSLLEKGKSNKKKRQEEDTTIGNLSDETTTHGVVSMQGNEQEALSVTQTELVSQQDKVLTIDKTIKVSEVTCVCTDVEKVANQHELFRLQSSIEELDHDQLEGGATNGHSSSCVGNGCFKGEGMVQEVLLAEYQHFSEHKEFQEDILLDKIDQQLEGCT